VTEFYRITAAVVDIKMKLTIHMFSLTAME